ncbi:unnamed protein product [Caenorhabditis sp. 36 PRJEB53466]|nr:unnamed protein product [Caenorhabditis sp. 36 PRJEB53466]
MASRGHVFCVGVSSFLAVCSLILLVIVLFSASFRYNLDNLEGTKNYGLFRFCYTPKTDSQSRDDDSNSKTCHLRNYINSDQCSSSLRNRGGSNKEKSARDCFGDFELATIILMCISIVCCIIAFVFSFCAFSKQIRTISQSIDLIFLLLAAICSLSGFLVYTYYYELKDNQYEVIAGYQYQIHYGWAYYVFGVSSLLQWSSFVCSLFGSAFLLVNKNKKRQSKVTSTSL